MFQMQEALGCGRYLPQVSSVCGSAHELRIINNILLISMSTFSLIMPFFVVFFLTNNPACPVVAGEPSAPKLEGHIGEDGNSIKVNVIKQDDGGSPIRHYLIKYKAVSVAQPALAGGN